MSLSDFSDGFARPTPAVDPAGIRRMWALMRDASAALPKVGIHADLVARVLGPEADVSAVWLRCSLVAALCRRGLLADWQHGGELEDRVFEVAATFPIEAAKGFDADAFLQRLRDYKV